MRLRLIVFLLLLLPAADALAQFGYHFGRNKVQYSDFEWRVLRTEHFDVYYYPEMADLAEKGAFFAEEAYDELRHRFNFALAERVPIIFYSSNLHFKQTNVTPGFIPDGVGGFFEFLKGRVVIPANGNIGRFRRVIRHELVHVFTFNKVVRVMRDHRKIPDRFLPLWFTEGLAEYWSGPPDHQHEMILRDAVFANYLVPLESMDRIYGTFVMYKQGEAICRYISEQFGEERILALLESTWKDTDFREVIEKTLHVPFEQFASGFDAWIKDQYYPSLPRTEQSSLIAEGISTRGFSAKPVHYRFADGTEKVYFVGNRSGYSNVYEVRVDSLLRPLERPNVLLKGERNDLFEAFHLFESRMAVSEEGKLAFVTKSGEKDVIHVFDLERDELEATVRFSNLVAAYSPSWSPEGDRLVFTSIDDSGYSDLYIYDLNGESLFRLTDDAYDDQDPSWSPDGRRIAFVSDRTSLGHDGAYNVFTYDTVAGSIAYVTFGDRRDFAPSWSPDGSHLVFISSVRDDHRRYSGQDIWVADMTGRVGSSTELASLDGAGSVPPETRRPAVRLTELGGAAYDPRWTKDGHLLFSSFEGLSFSIRAITDLRDRLEQPLESVEMDFAQAGSHWDYPSLTGEAESAKAPYKKRFKLDLAQGAVSQNPVLGTTGGAVVAFSDMLGDDHLYVTVFNTGNNQRSFLRSLSAQVARVQLHRRTNVAYGGYRFGGLRYDITDPDAPAGFPRFYETIYGGFGIVSYPLSRFRRIELGTSLNWSRKEIPIRNINREALLLSNSVSLVHDNALYWYNGPIDGWRAKLTAAYTTDVRFSNVSYYSLLADVRHYQRITRSITFASWAMARYNEGREARLYILGGSWDLRGFRLFEVRGQKMWFTSHELRFPILEQPSVNLPILAPLGIVNLRGAFFFDAAHAWNSDYNLVQPEINAGETVGAAGLGIRLNLFGGFILRYDIGYRYRDGFKESDKRFRQFFFGLDF